MERIETPEKRLMAGLAAVSVLSVWYVVENWRAAFPQASLTLRYSKSEITVRAAEFLSSQGLGTAGYRQLTLFDPDDRARLFLERELGLEEANRLMGERVPVWRWRARWFRPPEREELAVYLSPQGRLVGFRHVIEEAAPGARLAPEEARAIAEAFLRSQTEAPHRLVEQRAEERPARQDHRFTWEEEGFAAKGATLRRRVVVQGDRIGEYLEFLHVPEQWERDFARMRASNELFQWAAEACAAVLFVAAVILVIRWLRRRQIPWRPLVALSGVVGGLMVLNQLNLLAFFIDGMPTSTPFRETVLFGLLQAVGAGVGTFFYVILAAAAGEPLYRSAHPKKASLAALFSRRGLATKEFFLACVTGYGLTAVHLGLVVAFYLVGRRFGAWSPQDVGYSDLLSTAAPWLYPLTISVLASTSEEFWFRLLAIALLKRYLRSSWLALLVPALVWGFLHSNYPQQPGWIRGVEVGLIGVLAGAVMLRWGIMATLVWHYTVDAVFIGMFLFESGSWYFRLSGAAVAGIVLLPLAISLFFYRRNGGFVTAPGVLNEEAEVSPAPAEAGERPAPAPPLAPQWSPAWLWAAAAAGLLAGLLWRPYLFGGFIRVFVTKAEAAATADRALGERNLDPASWRRAVQFVTGLNAADFEYLRRLEGPRRANEIVRDRTTAGVWSVRYYRPLEREEWRVFVDQQGRAFRLDHVLDEKAPGARLTPEEARRRAEGWLAEFQKIAIERYRLVDSNVSNLENRTDHVFVWEEQGFRAGEATARLSLTVVGEDISYFRRFLKLPEEWLREFNRPRLQSTIMPALGGALGLLLLVAGIRRLSGREGEAAHQPRWRVYLAAGGTATVVALAAAANEWPNVLAAYDTAKPLQNYIQQALLSRLVMAVLSGAGIFLLALATDIFLQVGYGYRTLPRPSLARAVAVAALVWGTAEALTFASQHVPGDRLSVGLWSLAGPETYLPAFAALGRSLFVSFGTLCTATILASAGIGYLRFRTGLAVAGVVLALVALSRSTNAWQWLFHFAAGAVLIGIVWLVIRTSSVDLVSFGVALFWIEAARRALPLATQPAADLRMNGVAALAAAFAGGAAFLLLLARRYSKNLSPGLR